MFDCFETHTSSVIFQPAPQTDRRVGEPHRFGQTERQAGDRGRPAHPEAGERRMEGGPTLY